MGYPRTPHYARISDLLRSEPDRTFDVQEVAEAVGCTRNQASHVLYKLRTQHKVESPQRGLARWAAPRKVKRDPAPTVPNVEAKFVPAPAPTVENFAPFFTNRPGALLEDLRDQRSRATAALAVLFPDGRIPIDKVDEVAAWRRATDRLLS